MGQVNPREHPAHWSGLRKAYSLVLSGSSAIIWRAEKTARLAEEGANGVHSAAIFEALSRVAPADANVLITGKSSTIFYN